METGKGEKGRIKGLSLAPLISSRTGMGPKISAEQLVLQKSVAEMPSNGKLSGDGTARAQEYPGKAATECLSFESLLSDLAVRLLQASEEGVNPVIEHALRQILYFFEIDRCGLFTASQDNQTWFITHAVCREGVLPPTNTKFPVKLFPWVFDRIVIKHEVMKFSSLDELPGEAAVDRQTFLNSGIRSAVNIPILIGGPLDYFMAVTTDLRERAWPEEYISRLRLLGETMAHSVERWRSQRASRESEGRYKLLAENARDVIFTIDNNYKFTYISPSIFHLRGLTPEETMSERFSETLAPESREMVREVFSENSETGAQADTDTAIRFELEQKRKDGSLVWVEVLMQPILNDNNERTGFTGITRDITERKRMETELRERLADIDVLKRQLENENVYLREEVKLLFEHEDIVGGSDAVKRMLSRAEQVAPTDSTVLILGETGTGKELLARRIHEMSPRRKRTLVTVNCASLPPSLIESELFGREKGAYTGAMTRMAGRFETADGSTLFLDEIGELPYELQSKLLRVLEYGQFERLGSTRTIHVNVRLIAAANFDLTLQVADGKFRKDLFYRLNVFPITAPPLRERSEDIPALVWSFVRYFEKRLGRRIDSIPRKGMELLQRYPWPGNIRELKNIIEHAMIMSNNRVLQLEPPSSALTQQTGSLRLEDAERRCILDALEKTRWRVSGKDGAAQLLGVKRTTLQAKMKALGVTRP